MSITWGYIGTSISLLSHKGVGRSLGVYDADCTFLLGRNPFYPLFHLPNSQPSLTVLIWNTIVEFEFLSELLVHLFWISMTLFICLFAREIFHSIRSYFFSIGLRSQSLKLIRITARPCYFSIWLNFAHKWTLTRQETRKEFLATLISISNPEIMLWSFLRDAYSSMELPLSLNLVYKCFVLCLRYTFSSMDFEVPNQLSQALWYGLYLQCTVHWKLNLAALH